jgi:hypothetical protein
MSLTPGHHAQEVQDHLPTDYPGKDDVFVVLQRLYF